MDLDKIIIPKDVLPTPMVTCVIEGHLEEEDLRELILATGPAEDVEETEDPSNLKKVREKHHSVARMIAGGLTQRMVSKLCGYTENYLSILLNNPAMVELVELYRMQHGAAQQVAIEKLATVGMKALEKLEAQVDGGNMSNQDLLGVAKLGLDRGGLGPQSKVHNVNENHIIDHAELAERNLQARTRSASRIVPTSQVRQAIAPPKEQSGESNGNLGSEGPELHEDRGESYSEGNGE